MLGDLQSVNNRSVMTVEIAHEIGIVLQRDDAVSTREGSIGNANAIGGIATEREFGVERDGSASERTGDATEGSGHFLNSCGGILLLERQSEQAKRDEDYLIG